MSTLNEVIKAIEIQLRWKTPVILSHAQAELLVDWLKVAAAMGRGEVELPRDRRLGLRSKERGSP